MFGFRFLRLLRFWAIWVWISGSIFCVAPSPAAWAVDRVSRLRAVCDADLVSKSGLSAVELGTYKESTWTEYLRGVVESGEHARFASGPLVPVLERMPEPFATTIFRESVANYAALSRDTEASADHSTGWKTDLSPRRAIDAMILAHLNPADRLKAALEKGQECLAAYEDYLRIAQQMFQIQTPYDAQDVLFILSRLQDWHRSMTRDVQIPTWPKSFYRGEKELIVYGSLPLGKLNLMTSDIDVTKIGTSDFVQDAATAVSAMRGLMQLDGDVNAHFAASRRRAQLEVTPFYFLDKSELSLSPLIFRVLDDRIVLEGYSLDRRDPGSFEPRVQCEFP